MQERTTTTYGNNDRLTALLNDCDAPRRVLEALRSLLEPRVEGGDLRRQEAKIVVRDVPPRLDQSGLD